jgi:hypothetical protein
MRVSGRVGHLIGKNPGTVWRYPSSAFRGAHFAIFPEALIGRPILATCPERLCSRCQRPWTAKYERRGDELVRVAYRAACRCGRPAVPGLVLDPFFGSGTVGVVASRLGRDWLGVECGAIDDRRGDGTRQHHLKAQFLVARQLGERRQDCPATSRDIVCPDRPRRFMGVLLVVAAALGRRRSRADFLQSFVRRITKSHHLQGITGPGNA